MAKRELGVDTKSQKYFKGKVAPVPELDKGTRDMHPLLPFIISGGKNTERYYFQHISSITHYKFEIKPKYFGRESNYTKVFPQIIKEIIKKNPDAKIYCVFDWDTICGNKANIRKHEGFIKQLKTEMDDNKVVLCPSMPSFEYWFLLHFKNSSQFIASCKDICNILTPYMKSYFPTKNMDLFDILKTEKYVKDIGWVKKLCEDDRLNKAINRAKLNIDENLQDIDNHSYSYVYRIFTGSSK